MKRVIQAIPHPSSNTYYATDKRIYTRYHQKPQINKTSFQKNKTYKINTNIEQESMNEFISNIYKEKKYKGILDPTAPNNKNIFVETDSDYNITDRNQDGGAQRTHFKKSTQLLIAKTESQYPKTYNSQNVFRKDGLIMGYYIKANQKQNLLNKNYNTISNNRHIKKTINTPSDGSDERMIDKYNQGAQTQIRQKKKNNNMNYLNQTYNRYTANNGYFKKEIDLDEWPSVDKNKNKILYNRNLGLLTLEKEIKTENSNETDNQNINQNQHINLNVNQNQNIYQNQKMKYPPNMVYSKRNISDIKHSNTKSNISEISEDFINQYKKQQLNDYEINNYVIAGNSLQIASPKEYKFTNESEEESDRQAELVFYNEQDYQNYMNKKIIRTDFNNNNIIENDQGGKVDLYYGIMNNKKDIGVKEKRIIIRKDIFIEIEEIIRNDINKLNLLIKLQRFIKSYLYLREMCAMKIQAVWRGGNTRKIMDLYNDLDEFIFHLSKVQFNHFNNDFCFFIKQLFNIYKANISNENDKENYNIENENENENNEEEENDDENENCMEQISIEETDQKDGMGRYLYRFPEGSYFDQDKLAPENEVELFVEGNERKKGNNSKDYDRLLRDYDELYQ